MSETSGLCCAANSNCNECWHRHLSSVWSLCHFSAPSVPPHLNTKMLHSHLHNLNVWKSIALFSCYLVIMLHLWDPMSTIFLWWRKLASVRFYKIFILFVVTVDRGVVIRMYWKYPLFLNLKQQVSTSFGLCFFSMLTLELQGTWTYAASQSAHISQCCVYTSWIRNVRVYSNSEEALQEGDKKRRTYSSCWTVYDLHRHTVGSSHYSCINEPERWWDTKLTDTVHSPISMVWLQLGVN